MAFTPEHIVLSELFNVGINYIIPAYQRPYSWSARGKSDKDNQVNTMWSDLIEFFEKNKNNKNDYFMGSMVLVETEDIRTYEVVDGQQRLVTLALLLVSIKCLSLIHI